MFYNTTGENSTEQTQMTVNNAKQEEVVCAIFANHKILTPSQCHNMYLVVTGKSKTPLTSIRRAISDLTRQGRLTQTENKITGVYGKSENIWQFTTLHTKEVEEERTSKPPKKILSQSKQINAEAKEKAKKQLTDIYNNIQPSTNLLELKSDLLNLYETIQAI